MWIATDNASEFWEDQMEVALDDVACQFEEWASIQKKSMWFHFHLAILLTICMSRYFCMRGST